MMAITNGTAEYERKVKPADYESRGAKLSLSFTIAEGDPNPELAVAKVYDTVVAEVHRRIGLNGPAYTERLAETDTAKVEIKKGPMTVVPGTGPKEAAAVPPVNPSGDVAIAAVRPALGPKPVVVEPPATTAAGVPQANPTSSSSPTVSTPAPEPAIGGSPDPLAITAPIADPLVLDTPVQITDQDLHAAVHQAIEHKATAMQIRELTAEFTGVVGQSMTTLPQDQRPDFLRRLKELRSA